jgi:hypothetical protein
VPFSYYRRLNRSDRATYRRSDLTIAHELPDAAALKPAIAAIDTGLRADDRAATGRAARALSQGICEQLGAAPLTVRVLARRPTRADAELHGLYEREQDGTAVIRVWMRTAAQLRPVAFRTFVRTLLHELCHHFDFELLGLRDTFHTEGFFRRESSLARQLLPPSTRKRSSAARREAEPSAPTPAVREPDPPAQPRARQLGLFG